MYWGEFHKVLLVEDFAHHPTAVKAVLKGLEKAYPNRRILTLFEPASNTSRQCVFQKEFEEALSFSDLVFCLEPAFKANLKFKPFSARKLVTNLREKYKKPAFFASTTKALASRVLKSVRPMDLVIIMSNGGFGGISLSLLKSLKVLNRGSFARSEAK